MKPDFNKKSLFTNIHPEIFIDRECILQNTQLKIH